MKHLQYLHNKDIKSSITPLSQTHKVFFSLVHTAHITQLVWILRVKLAAILQLSQYCTFDGDSISTVITEPGQPAISSSPTLGIIHPMMNVVISHWSTINIRHISDDNNLTMPLIGKLFWCAFFHHWQNSYLKLEPLIVGFHQSIIFLRKKITSLQNKPTKKEKSKTVRIKQKSIINKA